MNSYVALFLFPDLSADYLDVPFGRSGPGTPGLPGSNGQQRTKRMRTSFKHHQLRTMKSYFAINHNPDAKDLKQLSQKTGLPKRVLQVREQTAAD
jgi:LIM homeobox protein 2/9